MTAKRNPAPPRNVKSQSYSSVTKNGRTTTRSRTVYRNGSVQSYRSSGPATPAKATPAASKKRTAAGLIAGGEWITAGNEELPNCVAVAIANSLLVCTGYRVDDAAVMQLHNATAGVDGVSIGEALSYVSRETIGGFAPVSFGLIPTPGARIDGALIGMTDGVNDHAVTWTPRGLISWGSPLTHDLATGWIEDGEAWFIDWLGREGN